MLGALSSPSEGISLGVMSEKIGNKVLVIFFYYGVLNVIYIISRCLLHYKNESEFKK